MTNIFCNLFSNDPHRVEWALQQLPPGKVERVFASLDDLSWVDECRKFKKMNQLVIQPSVRKTLENIYAEQDEGILCIHLLCKALRSETISQQCIETLALSFPKASAMVEAKLDNEKVYQLISEILEKEIFDFSELKRLIDNYPKEMKRALETRRVLSPPKQQIFVGCDPVWKSIVTAMPSLQHIFSPKIYDKIQYKYFWERDARVVLRDGSHLIPYPLKRWDQDYFTSLLPPNMRKIARCGKGFCSDYVENAHSLAEMLGVRAIQAKSCIEGGNCILTENGTLLGTSSVAMSMMALTEQGYFEKEMGWEARLEKTLDVIAEELGVSLKDLIVLDHEHVHIDIDILPAPGGRIFVHDPKQAVEQLSRITSDQSLLNANESPESMLIMENNIRILEERGFEVIRTPGHFTFDGDRTDKVLLFNGIFLEVGHDLLFLTNMLNPTQDFPADCPKQKYHPLMENAFKVFRQNGIYPVFVSNDRVHSGGIHCLCFEQVQSQPGQFPMIRLPDLHLPASIPTEVFAKFDPELSEGAIFKIGDEIGKRLSPDTFAWKINVPLAEGLKAKISIDGREGENEHHLLPGQTRLIF